MSIETASYSNADTSGEAKQALVDVLAAFEEFKQANDARLAEIENRHSADVLLEDKVARINDEISRLNEVVQRPALARAGNYGSDEEKAAFEAYMRGQMDGAGEIRSAAVASSTAEDNNVFIPEHVERQLTDAIASYSAFRHLISETVLDNGDALSLMFQKEKASASWVGETEERDLTTAPSFERQEINLNEIYCSPAATQRFIDDSNIDVEAWLIEQMAEAFAEAENKAFIKGSGSQQPDGLMNTHQGPLGSAGSRDKVLVIPSGARTDLPATVATERLLQTINALPAQFRQNASWLMTSLTQDKLRSMKDGDGNYIWSPSHQLGDVARLFGFPVYSDPHLDEIKANGLPIYFADFAKAYRAVRGRHTSLMRDPYSSKPNVIFYATRRVGGGVVNAYAVRALKITA